MTGWKTVLALDSRREKESGDASALADAIRAGADMRIGTAFRHNEHIDPTSDDDELIREVTDFRITYLLEDRWVAGIENLRVPIELPDSFGPRASMSFFLYNQDANQAIARPYLDGVPTEGEPGGSSPEDYTDWPGHQELASFDNGTNAPSSNFIYDFEYYHFMVRSNWTELLAHDADGNATSGDIGNLADAVIQGAEVKIAVRGLCSDLAEDPDNALDHEVFIHLGACFFYTRQQLLIASANPAVRTRPSIPQGYASRGWDFGWLMPRTDGLVGRWLCDPYTLKFRKDTQRYAMRWFVSD